MVNKAILVGRVGANPELKNLDGGNKVVNFSLATSKYFKDKAGVKQQQTCWHNIVAWGNLAEIIGKNVVKGSLIYIEGEISNRSYDDKDGNKKYTSEVVASEMKFMDSKKSEEGATSATETSTTTNAAPASKQAPKATTKASAKTAAPVTPDGDTDDLPF
jgi:single-strand DNA-binding protein